MSTKTRLPRISCPHCGARTLVRCSEQITRTYREVRVNCDNDECGHTMLVGIAVIRTLRPSAKPHPDVHLPLANQNLRHCGPRPANDDQPPPANDDDAQRPAAEVPIMSESG